MELTSRQWVSENVKLDYEKALELAAKKNVFTSFESLYESRKILKEVLSRVETAKGVLADKEVVLLYGSILYQLGKNHVDCEESSAAEKFLEKSAEVLCEVSDSTKSATPFVLSCNHLAIILNSRTENEKALKLLLDAKMMYEDCVAVGYPLGEHELLTLQEILPAEREDRFEDCHTQTLYYLSQVYGALDQSAISAFYCFTTLNRQLRKTDNDTVEWCINSHILSEYYLNVDNYRQSRYCVAAAEYNLQQFIDSSAEKNLLVVEKMEKTKGEIARCWVKYCIEVLKLSQEIIETRVRKLIPTTKAINAVNPDNDFMTYDGVDVSTIEAQVPHLPVDNFHAAREVFLFAQGHITTAKQYFTLEWHATDHVHITQNHSHLFKLLAFFEPELERQCRMHKRRADMLIGILGELNQQHYLVVARHLMFELGMVHNDIIDNKVILANRIGKPTVHVVQKINKLIYQSMYYLNTYMDTFRDHDGKLPEKYGDESLRMVLSAQLWLGRLNSKKLSSDPLDLIVYEKQALKIYLWIVRYYKANPTEVETYFGEEIIELLELVELMPHKIAKMPKTYKEVK